MNIYRSTFIATAVFFLFVLNVSVFADDITLTTISPGGGGNWSYSTDTGYENDIYATNSVNLTNGKVGIGTEKPDYNLHVSAPNGSSKIGMDGYGTPPYLYLRQARGTQNSPTATQATDSLGLIGFSGYAGTGTSGAFTTGRAVIQANAAENWTTTKQGSNLFFYTTPMGTIVPQVSMLIAENGGVGIGTLSAAGRLNVSGSKTGTGTVSSTGNTSITGSGTNFTTELTAGDAITASGRSATVKTITNNTSAVVQPKGFNPNISSQAFTINKKVVFNNSNVGIGTLTPAYTLNVSPLSGAGSGTVCIDGYGTGAEDGGMLVFRHASGTQTAPTSTLMSDYLGIIAFDGYVGSGFNDTYNAYIGVGPTENWTATARGSKMIFGSTQNGQTVPTPGLSIQGSTVTIGTSSGGGNFEIYASPTLQGALSFINVASPAVIPSDAATVYFDPTSKRLKIYQAGSWRYVQTTTSVPGSSLRYKENIIPLKDNFGMILQAEPKYFNYKNLNEKDVGYVAEDFDKIGLKNLVEYDEDGRPDNLKYEKISVYILEVVKKQQKEIEELTKKVEAFEKAVSKNKE